MSSAWLSRAECCATPVPASFQISALHIFFTLFTTILITTEEASHSHRPARIWIEKASHGPQRVWRWSPTVMNQGHRIIFDSDCIISYQHSWTFALLTHKKADLPGSRGRSAASTLRRCDTRSERKLGSPPQEGNRWSLLPLVTSSSYYLLPSKRPRR